MKATNRRLTLTPYEQEMADGALGAAAAKAIRAQQAVANFFDADSFVEISHAHVTVDYEVMGEAGLTYLRNLVEDGAHATVPTTRNSRSVCPALAGRFHQADRLLQGERNVGDLLTAIGVDLTNTCVPYEVVYSPSFGERVAWGDTGAAAFANGALGARTNFEGGVAGLWAAITGRTPRFGFQLPEARQATAIFAVSALLTSSTDWAVLGAIVGERLRGYQHVPLLDVGDRCPTSDELKGVAAALASYGSIGMFHVLGCTPEADSIEEASGGSIPAAGGDVGDADIQAFYGRSEAEEMPELVVFTAPQLSAFELTRLAGLVGGRHFHPKVTVIVTTSPQVRARLAATAIAQLEGAGATVVEGTCWYLMDLARMRSEFGWQRVLTNSPKLANIIPANSFVPVIRPTEVCVEAAVTGRL